MFPKVPVERFQLDNGLRVVLAPDPSSPAVGVAVHYGVGFRDETPGRTGFAHLFEHLMFQGSATLAKLEHFRLVQGNGGTFNGTTQDDFTDYFEVLPSDALELGLFLEADRMRGIRLDEANLRNQVDVVEEEVRLNVLNRPYGGFPWLYLPSVVFRKFGNAHNSYGEFSDLEAATLEDAADFFETYYTPANAVLTVSGNFEKRKALDAIRRHFEKIPPGKPPPPRDLDEPPPTRQRRKVHTDPRAPEPGVAIGYRVPNPQTEMRQYIALGLGMAALVTGRASRAYRTLVKELRLATSVSSHLGLAGGPFDCRHPALGQFVVMFRNPGAVDEVVEAFDSVLGEVAASGFRPEEVESIRPVVASRLLQGLDSALQRALFVASFESVYDDARLVNEALSCYESVSVEEVAEAVSRWLATRKRGILEWRPGMGRS
jgi:predicted Zn-dependent peptidase